MLSRLVLAAALAVSAPAQILVQPGEQARYDALLSKAALETADTYRGAPCLEAKAQWLSGDPVTVSDRPGVAARYERVKVSGCGLDSIENITVVRTGGDPPWTMVPRLPGDSHANTPLQRDAWDQALKIARRELPEGCTGLKLDDTYIAAQAGHVTLVPPGQPRPERVKGRISVTLPEGANPDELFLDAAWVEVWPLTVCGQDRTMMVVFMPARNGKGVGFLFSEVWRVIAINGPGARPAHDPPI